MYVQELKEEYKPLTKWWKKVLGDSVTSVKVSTRLSTTPCVVVAGKYGQSANMERIMRAQVRIVCVCVCAFVCLPLPASLWVVDRQMDKCVCSLVCLPLSLHCYGW
jgi:hypothetical protein